MIKRLLVLILACAIMPAYAQISFTDLSTTLGHQNVESGAPMAVVDLNNDGLDDIIRLDRSSKLVVDYQTDNGFIAYYYGSVGGSQWSICVADVNQDGFKDIFTGGAYNGLQLFTAQFPGIGFIPETLVEPGTFAQGSNFTDINNDGLIDLFVCNDDEISRSFQNTAFDLILDTTLINTASTVPSDNSGNYGSIWTDYDGDGDTDLYISKCRQGVTDPTDGRRLNLLFENNGDGTYSEVAPLVGLQPQGQSWATDFGDIDNDGDMDCIILNHDIPSALYRNDNGIFTNISVSAGIFVSPINDSGIQVKFIDLDNDGFVDILFSGSGSEHAILKNDGDLTFTNITNPLPTSDRVHSFATGDLNNDGFMDLIAGFANGYNSPSSISDKLYINDGNDNHFIKFQLEGNTSNIDGMGAVIRLYGPEFGQQVREIRAGESYGITTSFIKHFGTGTSTEIDSAVIYWPSGTIDKLIAPAVDFTYFIEEGNACALISAFEYSSDDFTTTFSNLSNVQTGSFVWDFGDGDTSMEINPTHNYSAPGNYQVCLTLNDVCGSNTYCEEITINCSAPEVDFSYQSNFLNINFTNSTQSTGSSISYEWTFGDGGQSNDIEPSHTYILPGNYEVCLTVTDFCGSNTLCETIEINCAPPIASFESQIDELSVNFTTESTSSTGFANYQWDFGDGTQSTYDSLTHTYTLPGTFEVCLTISDICGSNTTCEMITVNCAGPDILINSQSNELTSSFSANISDQVGDITYIWYFGDGMQSTEATPSHTYTTPGTYEVCLTATDDCGSNQTCTMITVGCTAPSAIFNYQVDALMANFVPNTLSDDVTYIWNFGDGMQSTDMNASHSYNQPGSYEVCLTVSDMCGSNQSCAMIVVECTAPSAEFNVQTDELSASFVPTADSTTGTTAYTWSFGDGTQSNEFNPTHTYTSPGNYNICFTITDVCGSNTFCQEVNISCSAPEVSFSYEESSLDVSFESSVTSQTGDANYTWDFGDGGTATDANTVHSFALPGEYQVCLTVDDICSSTTICETIILSCSPPDATFSYVIDYPSVSFTLVESNFIGDVEYLWDFEDGSNSTEATPTHSFSEPGTYTVCVTITDACGTNSQCESIDLNCLAPVSEFSGDGDEATIVFTDYSENEPSSWFWDFGDGNTSTEQDPIHVYESPGAYDVCLTVENFCGSDTNCLLFSVTDIEELSLNDEFRIGPNPAGDKITVYSENLVSGEYNITIYDTQSNLIFLKSINQAPSKFQHEINVEHLPQGVYYLKLSDLEGNAGVKKVVILY